MDTRPQGVIAPNEQGFDYNDSQYQKERNANMIDWSGNKHPTSIKNENSKMNALQNAGISGGVNVNGKYNK